MKWQATWSCWLVAEHLSNLAIYWLLTGQNLYFFLSGFGEHSCEMAIWKQPHHLCMKHWGASRNAGGRFHSYTSFINKQSATKSEMQLTKWNGMCCIHDMSRFQGGSFCIMAEDTHKNSSTHSFIYFCTPVHFVLFVRNMLCKFASQTSLKATLGKGLQIFKKIITQGSWRLRNWHSS